MELKELMIEESLQLKHLADLVKKSIEEEQMLSSRLIELEADERMSFGQKLADQVAAMGGSWAFIVVFFLAIGIWISGNQLAGPDQSFDPYPFILLNLVLSCIAAIQAPIIMMSQNRREEKDRRRARSDFMINLKAEMEVRNLHDKIDLLISEQMQSLFKIQQFQTEQLAQILQKVDDKG